METTFPKQSRKTGGKDRVVVNNMPTPQTSSLLRDGLSKTATSSGHTTVKHHEESGQSPTLKRAAVLNNNMATKKTRSLGVSSFSNRVGNVDKKLFMNGHHSPAGVVFASKNVWDRLVEQYPALTEASHVKETETTDAGQREVNNSNSTVKKSPSDVLALVRRTPTTLRGDLAKKLAAFMEAHQIKGTNCAGGVNDVFAFPAKQHRSSLQEEFHVNDMTDTQMGHMPLSKQIACEHQTIPVNAKGTRSRTLKSLKRKEGSGSNAAKKRNLDVFKDGDYSQAPVPVCSCTGVSRQCSRNGENRWLSTCCTTSITEYPLPMNPSRPGKCVFGRSMRNGSYVKLLERLAAEGYDFSDHVDLKDRWLIPGANMIVTEGTAIDFSQVHDPVCSCTGVSRQCNRNGHNAWRSTCCTTSISEYPLPMHPSRRWRRMTGRAMRSGPYVKLLQRLAAEGYDFSNAVDLKDHWFSPAANMYVTEGTTIDFSQVPVPVCSCTGVSRQCNRRGDNEWRSTCCTASISEYPLPMNPSRHGRRVCGREMRNGPYVKLLQRLAAEGYDFSNAVDLKDHWETRWGSRI